MASAVHYEAKSEPLEGKIAVASVIMNRTESKKFPSDVCSVVKQPRQFSWYPHKPLTYGNQKEFAKKLLNGEYKRTVPDAYFFTNVKVWFKRRVTAVIGGHRFYALD